MVRVIQLLQDAQVDPEILQALVSLQARVGRVVLLSPFPLEPQHHQDFLGYQGIPAGLPDLLLHLVLGDQQALRGLLIQGIQVHPKSK